MTNKIIAELEAEQIKKDFPEFGPGDTVIVQVKVKEGDRERIQAFEGVVIAKRNRGLNSAFTVRKISHGVGVERTFQSHSPLIDSVVLKRRGDVRKAKLYHLRELQGRHGALDDPHRPRLPHLPRPGPGHRLTPHSSRQTSSYPSPAQAGGGGRRPGPGDLDGR